MITFTRLHPFPRLVAASAMLALLPAATTASEPKVSDLPAQALAQEGRLDIQAADPYVKKGTFQIQVSTKLGRPSFVLPDGTWAYPDYVVEESAAHGILMIRFAGGRVSKLELVTAEMFAGLRSDTRPQLSARGRKTQR